MNLQSLLVDCRYAREQLAKQSYGVNTRESRNRDYYQRADDALERIEYALVLEIEAEAGIRCEHGVADGDWCEPCNKAYKAGETEDGFHEP